MNKSDKIFSKFLKFTIYLLILLYSYVPNSVFANSTNILRSPNESICDISYPEDCPNEIVTHTKPSDVAPVSYIYQTYKLTWDKLFNIIYCQINIEDQIWYKDKQLNYFHLSENVVINNSFQIRSESIKYCNLEEKTIERIEFFDTVFKYSDQYIYIDNHKYYLLHLEVSVNSCIDDDQDKINEVNLSQFINLININDFAGIGKCLEVQQITPAQSLDLLSTEVEQPVAKADSLETPLLPRYQSAVNIALSMLGEVTQSSGEAWNGWCDKFIAYVYGRSNSGYYSALVHYQALENLGLVHYQDKNVPPGGLAFFNATDDNPYGHVMISVGGGEFVSTGNTIHYETIESWKYGDYLGWAYPEDNW